MQGWRLCVSRWRKQSLPCGWLTPKGSQVPEKWAGRTHGTNCRRVLTARGQCNVRALQSYTSPAKEAVPDPGSPLALGMFNIFFGSLINLNSILF